MPTRRRALAFLVLAWFVAPRTLAAETGSDPKEVFVVCPKAFETALKPWVDYRTRQGYSTRLLANQGTAEQIRSRIEKAAAQRTPAAILLVGDAAPPSTTGAAALAKTVPGFRVPATVEIPVKRASHIGTDNPYADLDGDRVPDVPLGRLPVKTEGELRAVIRKIIAYESAPLGTWQRDINLVAGVGGFGVVIDNVIQMAAWQLVKNVPDAYRISLTQASWGSPFCPTPARFPKTTMERLNEGPLLWTYIGHGRHDRLDRVRTPKGSPRIMRMADLPQLRNGKGRSLALLLCCHAGAYDGATDCLAERMLIAPGGPIAVIAVSRVTMPYSMAVLANGTMKQLLMADCATLGEVFRRAKQELVQADPEDQTRKMMDQLAQAMSPTRNELAEERMEHLALFNLFGDPLLSLRRPEALALKLPNQVSRGGTLTVAATLPFSGDLTLQLVRSRHRPDYAPAGRNAFPTTPQGLAAMQKTYDRANRDDIQNLRVEAAAVGKLTSSIPVAADAPTGLCVVRAHLTDGTRSAIGSRPVTIMP
ncbi:MAG: hypothetical protein HN904_06830 [Victivallales bacterium]|nr:hypothetical protein [Victivallales bacterium]